MVNPGSFKGARRQFLEGEKPSYARAVVERDTKDRLADIQRRFFKRFPIDLADDVEPSPEALAAVDDDAPDIEPPSPDEENMSPEDLASAQSAFKARKKVIKYRRGVSHRPYIQTMSNLANFRAANQEMDGIPVQQGPPNFHHRRQA